MTIDDETLVAYLDGQLTLDTDYERIEDALAADAGLRLRMQQLVESGVRARQAFAPKFDEPVPAWLIAAIINAPLPVPADSTQATPVRTGVGVLARIAARRGRVAAFASVLLLALGALLSYALIPTAIETPSAPPSLAREGEPVSHEALMVALETTPSGRALDLGQIELELVVSFMNGANQFCREFELAHRGQFARTELGIACRESENQWSVAFLATEAGEPNTPDTYRTASDRLHAAANDFIRANARGEPLDPLNELVLIGKGWSSAVGEAHGQPAE